MLKVLSIFGTRPEAIKMAPVIKGLEQHPEDFRSRVCATGQHREMLDQVIKLFEIKPDFDLNIMVSEQDLFDVTCNVLQRVKPVLEEERPDIVLVQGDTTTTLAAGLAAFYYNIPVGHVEAGLRTWKKHAPFPEEINRKLTSGIADLHFAPTEGAKQNLLKEGVPEEAIHVTGNTVIDALLGVVERIKQNPDIEKSMAKQFPYLDSSRKLILVTGHRRESFGHGFEKICLALKKLGEREDVQIIYPVHLNPNVQEQVNRILRNCQQVNLIKPLDYLPFVYLMKRSHLIITDSGGIQEEAPSLGKPVLVMREATERPEAVDAGTVKLVGTDPDLIIQNAENFLNDQTAYEKMAYAHNPYGDGKAAERIINSIMSLNL
jgi:UDP-N-acetylglucosamine 2-epimerase (non-hydrolysing)